MIKQSDADFKEVDVEEMDLAKGCYGQDSRYIAGHGYATQKYPGMIFQKDQLSDLVSKIRLTKRYRGKLPDGNYVNMEKLLLRDLFIMYPELKEKWGSRGCTNYWNFSNDTLSFYVKIDSLKKPQFPIDKAYYLDKPVAGIDIISSCYKSGANDQDFHVQEIKSDPVFLIDSIRVNKVDLARYEANDIASMTIYKNENAIKLGGSEAINGLVYIETKKFATVRYQRYFKFKSHDYAALLNIAAKADIQYILNEKVLTDNFESDLASINDNTFKQLKIINKEQLVKQYKVANKVYGVIINSVVSAKTN